MSIFKVIDLYRDFAAGRIFLIPRAHTHPPLTHCVYVYTVYLFTQGRGGGGCGIREKVRGATVHKAGSKI
jgi:hypothetical protein